MLGTVRVGDIFKIKKSALQYFFSSGVCVNEWALLVKSVSKLYLQVDLICQNKHLVSYRQVPGSIPGRGSIDYFSFFPHFSLFFDSVPLLFHSNFQSWQILSLPTLDPYLFLSFGIPIVLHVVQIVRISFTSRNWCCSTTRNALVFGSKRSMVVAHAFFLSSVERGRERLLALFSSSTWRWLRPQPRSRRERSFRLFLPR